jgi:uncharacterized MAPEG superfamily protein
MPTLQQNPAFTWYAITCLVLCLNLVFLWAYSGSARSRTGTAINPEDSERFKVKLAEADPPTVARVLRAHRNAEACIYPFLILGLVYVLGGGGARTAAIVFGIFTAARLVHSWAYITGKQPLRSICFGIGGVALLALMVCVVLLLIPHGGGVVVPIKGS